MFKCTECKQNYNDLIKKYHIEFCNADLYEECFNSKDEALVRFYLNGTEINEKYINKLKFIIANRDVYASYNLLNSH